MSCECRRRFARLAHATPVAPTTIILPTGACGRGSRPNVARVMRPARGKHGRLGFREAFFDTDSRHGCCAGIGIVVRHYTVSLPLGLEKARLE